MGISEHQAAIQAALKTNDKLAELFGMMGSAEKPNGAIMADYRYARKALRDNLSPQNVREMLGQLRQIVSQDFRGLLGEAVQIGLHQANANLEVYGLPVAQVNQRPAIDTYLAPVLSVFDSQAAGISALAISGNIEESLILGDESRVGLLSPAAVLREGARWLAVATLAGFTTTTNRGTQGRDDFLRQAIAAIDERTTNCCLNVNGQVKPVDEPFELAGTPRFADRMQAPGFHHYCRSATALVHVDDAGDRLTREMRDAARAELKAREDGSREEIHPAFGASRRG